MILNVCFFIPNNYIFSYMKRYTLNGRNNSYNLSEGKVYEEPGMKNGAVNGVAYPADPQGIQLSSNFAAASHPLY
jgi:hypothetical protein